MANEKELKNVDGKNLVSADIFYQNLIMRDDQGEVYYLTPQNLLKILRNFKFIVQKKRTRTWVEEATFDRYFK